MDTTNPFIPKIEVLFRKMRPHNIPTHRACLVWTCATIIVLTQAKKRALLQAGTCWWPRVTKDQDDGICPTHFGYEWSPWTEESKQAVLNKRMPEIHIWTALPDEDTIIDMSTEAFPKLCRSAIHADWPGERPPKHFWCNVTEMPEGVLYKPEMDAIVYASNAMTKFLKDDLM